jgi:toxin CcdB
VAQFSVYRNTNADSKGAAPLLLDIQSDLIENLGTRVVVPLCPASTLRGKVMKTLTPQFDIDGRQYVMLTPQLAGVSKKLLGSEVADLARRRPEIIAALDLLITGI